MGDIDDPRLADEVSVDSLWKVVAYTLLAGMALGSAAGLGAALFYLLHSTLVAAGLFLVLEHALKLSKAD